MIPIIVMLHTHALFGAARVRARLGRDGGQTTAEYALVLLGAAAVALLVLAWATETGKVSQLLNAIMDNLKDKID